MTAIRGGLWWCSFTDIHNLHGPWAPPSLTLENEANDHGVGLIGLESMVSNTNSTHKGILPEIIMW